MTAVFHMTYHLAMKQKHGHTATLPAKEDHENEPQAATQIPADVSAKVDEAARRGVRSRRNQLRLIITEWAAQWTGK